uniref:PWWP domain-containing protein n=1 Tax=Leersia perrieri TaxID=77586 RepID=A0A0D9XRC8_9ORYZ
MGTDAGSSTATTRRAARTRSARSGAAASPRPSESPSQAVVASGRGARRRAAADDSEVVFQLPLLDSTFPLAISGSHKPSPWPPQEAAITATPGKMQLVPTSPHRGRPKKQPSPSPQEDEEGNGVCVRYECAFQNEGNHDFEPPDLVWGKVRSHPWWPGQVFDAADASELALKHTRTGTPLVAYFWDKTFAWSDSSSLLPFCTNFTRLAGQSTMSGFVSAVDAALQEVGRRVEAGLSCACFDSSIGKRQEIENSGIREGAYGAVVDGPYMRGTFRGRPFLDYILGLGTNPLAGADRLELTTAKAQLRAFNCSRGIRHLPEFVVFEGIEDVPVEVPHTKRKRVEKSSEDDVVDMEKKPRRGENSSNKKKVQPNASRKEVMDEEGYVPSIGATDDTLSKTKKLSNQNSAAKRKKFASKDADGVETVGASKRQSKKAVDEISSENKPASRPRSTRMKGGTPVSLRGRGKDGGAESVKVEGKNTALVKENKVGGRAGSARKKEKIAGDGDGVEDGNANISVSPGKKRSGRGKTSVAIEAPISEQGRKKKKLSDLMAVTDRTNSSSGGNSKTRSKRSTNASTEKFEDPDHIMKDTMKTRKRKKLDTLGDLSSQPQPVSHKSTTKVGKLMHKAAGQMSETSPVLKANGEVSQKKSRRTKDRQTNTPDKSAHSSKVNKSKTDTMTGNSLPCSEMLLQLSLAAFNRKKREKLATASMNFFTDFRKYSYASRSDVEKGIYGKAAGTDSCASVSDVDEDIPEKAACTELTPLEQPLADHMQDDYWADILINVEEPLSSLKKKKDKGVSRTSKKVQHAKKPVIKSSSLGNVEEPIVEGRQDSEQSKAETQSSVANGAKVSAEETESSSLAGLVLHFSRPGAVPSRSDLIKIFSQYGPVNEAKAETANNANCAQVVFKRRMDAEAAFAGAGKISALGPALVSFRLSDFPATASGNDPRQGASKSE